MIYPYRNTIQNKNTVNVGGIRVILVLLKWAWLVGKKIDRYFNNLFSFPPNTLTNLHLPFDKIKFRFIENNWNSDYGRGGGVDE